MSSKKKKKKKIGSSSAAQEKLLLDIVQLYREKLQLEVQLLKQAQG